MIDAEIKKILFQNNYLTNEIKLQKSKQTKSTKGELLLSSMPKIIAIIGSVFTFYWGIVQFFYSQNLIDRRKYRGAYYDERYRILKDLTKSISEINTIATFHPPIDSPESKVDTIVKKMVIFNYAKLLLNEEKHEDSLVLAILNVYEDDILNRLNSITNKKLSEVCDGGNQVIKHCGIILSNEKDSVNSFKFKFWPFDSF